MIRIKICGVTTPADALVAVGAGAHLVGVNFVPSSRRRVSPETARSIKDAIAGRAEIVGVVADLSLAAIAALVQGVGLDRVQLHGHEPPAFVRAAGDAAFKAVRLGEEADVTAAIGMPGRLVLVDAKVAGVLGGTGRRAPSALAARVAAARPTLLAGGLRPDNVAEAIRAVAPWGVDVASGVERAPGVKDPALVRAFVAEVRRGRVSG